MDKGLTRGGYEYSDLEIHKQTSRDWSLSLSPSGIIDRTDQVLHVTALHLAVSMYHSLRRLLTERQTRPRAVLKRKKESTTCLVRGNPSYLHPFPSYNFPIACPVLMAALATKHFQSEISSIKFLRRSASPITRCCQHSDRSDLLCSICSPS